MCVFITAVPITKLFAREGGGEWRTCATRDYEPRPMCVCVRVLFIGIQFSNLYLHRSGYASQRPRGVVCPSRTNERGGEGYCVKEGGGEEGERERERAGEVRLHYSLGY